MTQAIVAGSAVAGSVGATLVTTAVAGGADAVMIMGITNRLTYDVWANLKSNARTISREKHSPSAVSEAPRMLPLSSCCSTSGLTRSVMALLF